MRDLAALRDFVERDWGAAERDEDRWWREHEREHGSDAGFLVGAGLRRHVLAARPDWPSEQERAEDLATHLRVIDVLRRVRRGAR